MAEPTVAVLRRARRADPDERVAALKRVVHVISGLGIGGAETQLVTLLGALASGARARHTVVALISGGARGGLLRDLGVETIELGMATRGLAAARIPQALFQVAQILHQRAADVVVGWMYHGNLAALLGCTLARRRDRTRVVWGIRCADLELMAGSRQLRAVVRLGALASRQPDLTIFNSQAALHHHVDRLGFAPNRVALLPNAIDVKRFRPNPEARRDIRRALGVADDRLVVTMVARRDRIKEHQVLAHAAARVGGALTVVFVGEGTAGLGVGPNQLGLGARNDIPAIYAASDVVALISRGESFPNVVAEGMATGLPVLATDVGDVRQIVGDAGWVVPAREPDTVQRALLDIVAARGRLGAMGERGRRTIVQRFAVERIVGAFTGLVAEDESSAVGDWDCAEPRRAGVG